MRIPSDGRGRESAVANQCQRGIPECVRNDPLHRRFGDGAVGADAEREEDGSFKSPFPG
ncbi:MAG TPA: hypothetical protein PLU72_00085 [Candidatus Ozemobacteraceae bacterium]|nr:hypothetical protein [Candidatus Ozemobacteraceae bacterium]